MMEALEASGPPEDEETAAKRRLAAEVSGAGSWETHSWYPVLMIFK